MTWTHFMNPIFLGLCPICWLFIFLAIVLIVIWFRIKPAKASKKEKEMYE